MTHYMTEMIITERNTYRKTESAHCHTVDKEMATCTQGVPKVYPRCTQALGRLMSMLRVWLEAAWKQPRRSLEYAYALPTLRLRSAVMLIFMMVVGVNEALAEDDYSGTYYIANYKLEENSGYYSTSNLTKNYYLCPTEGYVFFQSPKNYSTSDTGMPFLTTYKARNHADYDLRKMVWIIKKSGDYYTIQHALTGKYITYNEQIQGTSNAGRMRFHLEESDDPGDNMKFEINNPTGTRYTLCPKNSNSNSLNPATGNKDNLTADGGSGGPAGVSVGGIVGQYESGSEGSQWVLEEAVLFPTITIDDATGKATITSEEGTTIRYALDDATPTIDGTSYTSPIDISGHTAIKAIAVRTSDNKISVVVTLNLKEYTYKIVNRAGNVAIQHTIKQLVGKQLGNSYTDIPTAIRSPYLEGEDVTFLSNFTDFDHLDDYKITETPSAGSDIYVVYTTTHLMDKFLHLRGASPLNLTVNGDYIYDSGTAGAGTFAHEAEPTDSEKESNPYFWFFSGEDPYAIEIKNAATNNIIGYATPSSSPTALTLNTSPANSKFIIMATSGGGEYQQMELMAATGEAATGDNTYYRVGYTDDAYNISTTATGDASLQIQAYPNSATITYKLIDQAGKILMDIQTKSDAVNLPSDWQSPLVEKYNYWKVGAFDTYGTGDNTVYKLKADPESWRINNITEAEGYVIYVTYEVNDKITFDISDDDKTHSGEYQTYMLKFYQGQDFYQENGKDGLDVSEQKAEFPYSNGDAMLYVYSDAKREAQFASGASTRARWLWYVVSPKAAKVGPDNAKVDVTPGYIGDPYHVKIMSNSGQASSHNYFRTYVVNYDGSDHVVTGVTTKNENVNAGHANQLPTEYMVLSAPNSRYKLVTVNEIEGAPENGSYGRRQTVNTFEQYWKNNPTVQNRLGDAKVTASESTTDNGIELTSTQASILSGWHTYQAWANAAPWVSWSEDGKTGKKYQNKHHWFQTIDMGATGEFTFETQSIDPEVILLDQHGWEIMRAPLSDAAALRKYDSPMVQEYQWYPTAAKVTGYHKYKVSNPNIPVYYSITEAGKTKWYATGDSVTFTSTTLGANPYDYIVEKGYKAQDKSVKTDFYVTYTVKPEYARLYSAAATESAATPSAFMVKQGNEYAKISDSNQLDPTADNPYALPTIGEEWHWYVKPNFNIDKEMGYEYDVEEDDGAGGTYTPNQAQKDAKNYEEGRNGFDPYNVQIQSVKNSNYYFKTTTTGSHLNKGAWEGTSTDLSLKNMSAGRQENIDGNDQTKLSITNATFMVIKDASDHMLLMPRFDHTKVVNSFSGEQLSAPNAATKTLELIMAPKIIHSSNEFASLNGQYTLAEDFTFESDFTSLGSDSSNPFTGSIDGGLHKLSGLSNLTTPLIAYADGAIIKNIILDEVTIGNAEDVPNVGAIVANATGETRIYNCGINGGSVGGTGDVGGIVGNLHGEEITVDGKKKYIGARVINCYSYATITSGTNVGGIVGYNDYETTASKIATMVMNCAFYGDITGGSTVSPVYGGKNINNIHGGLATYNYYAYENLKTKAISSDKYNCALGVQDVFWNRFEQYRQLLNSNRKLAAYYASSTEATVKPSDMMKWVLETADRSIVAPNEPKAYPILKVQDKYPSIINFDAEHAPDSASVGRNKGGKLGKTLTVHLSGTGITTSELTLQRTDKDFDRFNFNYDKVQLPYFNDVGTGNYTNNQVVTGWKITGMTGGTTGTYTAADNFGGYNFADRKCTAKDIYDTSGRVFSQGAYFDVPYGVTEIFIEPYWGEAVYVADHYLDVVYNTGYTRQDVSQLPETYGDDGVEVSINGSTQKVWHTIGTAVGKLSSDGTVYDHAVVLVGNVHLEGNPPTDGKSFTVMSADLDFDNEPDYSFIFGHNNRQPVSPIRFDFINMPGIAMAQKPKGSSKFRNVSIFNPKGWFETTNTCITRLVQFEYDNGNKSAAPVILQGGMIDQFVSTKVSEPKFTTYLHLGGNTWFKDFGNGTHSDGDKFTPHIPISVTGGDFDGFYLSGTYKPDAAVKADNAECYISGGRFKEAAGAAQQQINGDVQWQIYNADIENFYGGGVNAAKPITGNIIVDIINSHVGTYCGGPKFGNMSTDANNPEKNKTVTTTATGSTFDYYFGAGYGGVSYNRVRTRDTKDNVNFSTWESDYTDKRGKYYSANSGIASDFDYEFFVWSTGEAGGRFYVKYSSLSTAQTNDVTSTLTNCIINRDFYGGGSLGNVIGTATSTLEGCTVEGNVFGGGYSASQPKVPVRIGGFKTDKAPKIDSNAGVFDMGEMTDTEEFTLVQGTLTNNASAIDNNAKTIITDVDLTTLGQVTNTDLTIKGNTIVKGQIFDAEGHVTETTGGVFGGGDMSAVNGNTKIDIQNTDATGGVLNVFGGGNTADVIGNSQVDITGGKVIQSVYGGGKGQTTIVGGNVIVNMGAKTGEAPSITYSGTGVVQGDVYGGSALGKVNTTTDKTTTVNVYGGTVNGSVFGGGLGQVAVAADPGNNIEAKSAIVAENQGNTTINVEGGLVKTAVYGGSNVNGVLKKDATVTLIGGTVGDSENQNRDVVFGGGFGAPTLVNGNVTVNVGTMTPATPPAVPTYTGNATIHGHVYGGGALGNTNEAWVTDTSTELATTTLQPVANTQTLVNLYAGTINGYAYGGALGNAGTPAIVGGDVTVTLDGAKVQQVFGANNINGTPKGHVKVWVKKTNNFTDNEYKNTTTTPRASRTTYDVQAVYGGGNQADYIPADALLDPAVEGNSAKIAAATAEVIIEGCDKTSINAVYGGGNAAAVPATDVTVKGSYIINTLYGGGNGESTPTFTNPGANVGIYKVGDTPTNYGTGKAVTKLLGGFINDVYGGSNTKGDVRGGTDVRTKGKTEVITGDCCTDLNVGQVYGAGSQADVKGDVNIILECMPDDFVDAVYGGAKNATINGNVSLTVTSGKFGRVFGGNNEGGSINGSITVNVYEDGCKPLIIGEVYGGGNAAPYSIYGCTQSGDTWTANESGDLHFDQEAKGRAAIQVNVVACTSVGKVFGGGMGASAKVIGNTNVDVNLLKGIVNGVTQGNIGKIGQVFGGGGFAEVKGNTLVEVGTKLANEGEDEGVNIISGTDYLDPSDGSLDETITAGIYGGGYSADIDGNTTLNIGTKDQRIGEDPSVTISGDIFGGGFGATTHVTGDVVVNIGKRTNTALEGDPVYAYEGYANITGDVYGGSAQGKVNSYLNNSVETASEGKTTHVNFYGGTINGNIHGGGLGDLASLGAGHADHAADVYGPVIVTMEKGSTTNTTVNNVFGCNNVLGTPKNTVTVNINGGTVNNSVYGGGNQAAYTPTESTSNYPAVNIINGTITENVFGGGLGTTATATSNPHVTIGDNVEGHVATILKSVYGGGSEASVDGNTNIVVNSGTIGTEGQGGPVYGNIYGGGYGSSANVRIGLVTGNTNVTVNGGNVLHNIYGGGAYGSVGTYTYASEDVNAAISALATPNTGKATILIKGGTIGTDGHENGMIFGASRGDIDRPGVIQDNMAWVYDTEVIIGTSGEGHGVDAPEPQIKGSVYGSGENGHTFNDASVTIYSGKVGITDTSIDGGAAYAYRGNVYGGGCGTDKYYENPENETHDGKGTLYNPTAGIVRGNATVAIDGGHVVRNVYGAGAMGSVIGQTTVNISGKSVIGANGNGAGYVYAAARGADDMSANCATVGSTALNISGGTVWGSAFGGGQLGTVKGSVAVNVSGGVVKNDVYGGGALANTNTDNWNTAGSETTYVSVAGLATETYRVKEMAIGASVAGLYTYNSGTSTYVAADGTAIEGIVYYEKLSGAPVAGYYTESAGNYTRITNSTTTADGGATYYKKVVAGSWADGKNDPSTGTTYKTTVSLTGGLVGNVYGGGLGNTTTMANVYGDVTVTVNQGVTDPTKGVAFIQQTESPTIGGTVYPTPVSGRVFGGNNHNGTPTGNITVHVYSTRQLDSDDNILSGHGSPDRKYSYEIQSVYGGGNQADYMPADGKKSQVIIDGCNDTSIEKVYGGGNSAVVPETDVLINGAYDIGYAFGGGNGDKPIKLDDGTWRENEGAIVIGLASIICQGGKIGQVFGGGDAKGSCGNTNAVTKQLEGGCPLHITRLYGAGNKGDVQSVNIVLAACSDKAIDYVHGGSYNAHVHGNVHLTITSGILKNVYGGNDARGGIEGNIIVDIEETNGCNPIIIQNLVGGGNEAPYPGTKTNDQGVEVPIGTHGKITVNVKSATRIDNIYGGSFMAEADADTEININMIKGCKAGKPVTIPQEFSYIPNISGKSSPSDGVIACTIDDAIGTIGNVYGGGNKGLVKGNATVNIGASTNVQIMARKFDVDTSAPDYGKIIDVDNIVLDIEDGKNVTNTIKYNNETPLGVHITGDVFGGGKDANVTGNAFVNICAKESATPGTYEAVAEGAEKVTISEGSVYGGGSEADVLANARVTMAGGYVYDGVYGGGLKGSVGTFTRTTAVTTESNNFDHSTHSADCKGKPTACADGTGTCTVVISGGQVGPVEVATKGMKNEGGNGPVDVGFVFGAGRGDVENPNDVKDADFHTFVNKTDVTISGGLIMASVYGGGENGRVLHDTHVTISGGQIGCGEAPGNVPKVYTDSEWESENASTFKECLSWDYKSPFLPYDPFAAATDTEDAKIGTDGHTYYGSVFGGGSGYYPYEIKNIQGTVTGHEWLRSAGAVYGNTVIDITGGHIMTCVYGGNETTDVGTYSNNAKGQPLVKVSGGKCTINMVGGTIGVPRTDEDATKHPVTCYLFGAGKGDQRTHFNTWTNVQETVVNVSGTARIFGSVFGGGEDGHVLGDAQVNIGGSVTIGETTYTAQEGLKIGTTGTSYVDGNVFGGGRGFSGEALTAGSTGGNAEVNIFNGTMLGSIYGGGRLASVGIDFTPPTDPLYGQLVDDTNEKKHGHIAINISGGTIGNDVANAKYGGNVFGGSMGRITLLDGTLNPIWPKQAVTKDTEITITGNAEIKRNVYGGSEYGIVRDKAIVNIGGTRDKSTGVVTASGTPTIHGSVFGAGYGSDDTTPTFITAGDYASGLDYVFTPMIWTGCVSGDTEVNIAGGTVKKNVYGGGEVASVGLINCHVVEDENGDITIGTKKYRYTNITKHADIEGTGDNEKAYGFALSWPYKFEFIPADPKSDHVGGKAIVNVTGGHIGSTTWDDRSGYVFGGSKGQVAFKKKVGDELVNITDIHEQRYVEGLCANVRETKVNVNYTSTPSDKTTSNIGAENNCIMGAVYGGGEDGHVYENAAVNITGGLIGLSVYGGGKGEGTYTGTKYVYNESTKTWTLTENVANMPSWTAGKVYGNTSITMSNGHVMGNVYGGGNLGSVGKGNYAGGTDDYYPAGYGETLQNAHLWTKTEGFNPDAEITESNKPTTMADYFLSSGKCTISITGGTVGTLNGLYGYIQGTNNGTPTGMVFGGSRGRTAQDVEALSPRYNYAPDFFMGYVNNTEVTIGTRNADTGPRIYSQVFGGARDGHVRGSAKVEVNSGIIGQTYAETEAVGTTDVDYQRYHRGNVYGSGSGLGTWDGTHHGTSSGSVTRNTTVDIYGGTIYNNVYGGGAMATVGPPLIGTTDFASSNWSKCTVNIYGGTIGEENVYNDHKFGGTIYGGSRGDRGGDLAEGESINNFASVLWTEVNINGGNIAGNVYGGARGGQVKKDTKVSLTGGVVKHNAYGGGRGTTAVAADVLGNTTVELNKGVASTIKGCAVKKVFGCNDLNGTPKGHVLVHVYATQKEGTAKIVPEGGKLTKFKKLNEYTSENYTASTNADDLNSLATSVGLTPAEISAHETAISGASGDAAKKAAIDNYIDAIADKKYDVLAVYGGGDLAPYNPTSEEENTEVIIDGCEETSIKQVYGGGNAASVPATKITVNSAYEIHESFGGGNGKDDYELDTKWYKNPGANVGYSATFHHNTSSGGTQDSPYAVVENNGSDGYKDATTKEARIANYAYGNGHARIEVYGGRIHRSYGGSNEKGNIRYEASSAYEESGSCQMNIDETYGGGKNAETDADIRADMECVDYMDEVYGGSTSGDVNSDIVLNITNGTFGRVFGGNKEVGRIHGSITVNVKEMGCKPIIIGGLYAGGYKADYSIYGYTGDTHNTARSKAEYDALSDGDKAAITVRKDPRINIISATRIDSVYGGGFQARVVGNPHINVNMEEGTLMAKYMKEHAEYLSEQTETRTGSTIKWRCRRGAEVEFEDHTTGHNGVLPIGTIGNIFGGGDQANVDGNTCVEIGTGKHHNDEGAEEVITPARNAAYITGRVYGGGNLGDVTGNTTVEMSNGYVYDRIYGGCKEGNVGTVTSTSMHTGNKTHNGCIGKPTAFAANTGKCTVTVSGGRVGPYTYSYGSEVIAKATPNAMTMPMDFGYVFGAGRGELTNPDTDSDIDFRTYVNETEVIIKNTYEEAFEGDSLEHIVRSPLIAGGVYGGSENGRVLNNTHVNIWGGQIGIGAGMSEAFNEGSHTSEAYAESDFINPTTATAEQIAAKAATMAECAAWPYGIDTNTDGKNDTWLPYDEHAAADASYGPSSTTGTDGHTFYGNVFGGGSGYFAYETATEGVYEWLPSAGLVEGDTYVNISGGHILTNVYGGNEMTNVTGTAHVTMTGGTLGVPRTLAQIAAHPVTCYLFGAGKGDLRVHFNKSTNVGHAVVNVSGGIIYGSVFGGGEDGHVLGDVTMNISDGAKIGTWGTSYVDGNVFGGGRGFAGDAYTAGNVAGSVTLNITGGTMLGSVYGGGRLGSVGYGLYAATEIETAGHKMYGEMQDDGYGDWYLDGTTYKRDAKEGFKRGHVEVNISGGTIGNDYEFLNVPSTITTDGLAAWKTTNHVPNTTYETTDNGGGKYTHRLLHTKGGNVYVGGMGRREQLDGTSVITDVDWHKLGNVKSTKLTMTGGTIKGNVYGGGEYGGVQGTHTTSEKQWGTEINITGGTIGTEIVDETVEGDTKPVMYTYGSVFGGGTGTIVDVKDNVSTPVSDVNKLSAYVANNAKVAVTDAIVRGSVYGGGELSAVGGNTDVTISGTTKIGRDEVKPATDADAGYVMFGGWRMGNVYGGGRGSEQSTIAGLVKGNTNVLISGGNVYHNVYGGGALGSVGNFNISTGSVPTYIPIAGVPYDWKYTDDTVIDPANPNAQKTPTGTATVTITGGTIGISGRDNGLVFGSSRGGLQKPTGTPLVDPYDRVAWVNKSVVTIGTSGSGATLNTPLVKGSVYGGGENGHNNESATVNVYSGTIGVTDTEDTWYSFTDKTLEKDVQLYRGNVYGAGSGSDTYTGDDSKQHYNPKSGMVGGNTFVNIAGGHVGRSVYGGGAMATVGTITSETKHESIENGFGLSWPYKFEFAANTGKATVNVTGGHIGTRQLDGGDVYGSSRGEAGNRYEMANLALTNETEVNINYPTTIDMTSESAIQDDFTKQCITGSVHGSGENGYVYGDTYVTLNKGLVGHSLYGAGKGKGTYTKALNKLPGSGEGTYDAKIYSLIAGKVMGNTNVTMYGGHVGRNVYGGGNMGSVGKGNYSGGADDYYPTGYGETLTGNLWDNVSDDSKAFLSSGKATVKVLGGIVGYIDETDPSVSMKNELPYGNVFGGSAGEAAPNIAEDPRYLYSPAFFSGYVNETDVTIGITSEEFEANKANEPYKSYGSTYEDYLANHAPKIFGSVYGGGQDGHVRRDAKVTVYSGEIGLPYTSDNQTLLKTDNIDSPQWMHRGNIYGGGSGITKYKYDFNYDGDTEDDNEQNYSNSSGSVTRFTEVNVLGGTIHRNVYGGCSNGSVGAPKIEESQGDLSKKDLTNTATLGKQSMNTVNIGGGSSVVTIGTPFDTTKGWSYDKTYGGEVYGACRGMSGLDPEQFANSVWTLVNIKDKATIMGNVYGGGDNGKVKKDTDVVIGAQ